MVDMGKNLERFVRDNRADFDTESPSDNVWQTIEAQLGHSPAPNKKVYLYRHIRMAAAAVAIIIVTIYTYSLLTADTNRQEVAINGNGYISNLDPVYAAELARFTTLIDEKQTELKSLQNDNPVLYEKFSQDIQKLDSTYGLLKNQLPVNPNKEELLQAMIWNLQLQIDLLNQQLNIIQKIKQSNSHSL